MRVHWIVLFVLSAVCGLGHAAAKNVRSDYAVDEILAVRSVSAFECRLKDYPYAKTARFRVQIRDVELNAGASVKDAAAFTAGRLNGAEHIELKNIRFRNYFRVTADVMVDGSDLADELREQGLAKALPVAVEPVRKMSAVSSNTRRPSGTATMRRRSSAHSPTRAAQGGQVQRITLKGLMDTRVDLSAIDDETSFSEALDVLSNSVRPKLPLLVLWNDLEVNALVDKDMPIGVGGFGTLKLGQALRIILANVSRGGMELELAFEGRVITIGTQRGLLQKTVTRTYKIEDLTSPSYSENGDLNNNKLGDLMGTFQGSSSQ